MMDPMIKPYSEAHREQVLDLLRLNTPKSFAPSEESDLIYYLDNHAQNFYVVETEKTIVACGGFNFSDDGTEGKISWDIIDPNFQGKGIGSKLTRYRIEKLREYPQVKSISVRTSQMAWEFYQKQGFFLTEIQKDYWAPGFHMYKMVLKN
jgi:[ribosomal protein S18]-alanine N-acetyltransferase